jgi:hypothetical protein
MYALKPPKGDPTRGESELMSEKDIHAEDASKETDDDEDGASHPFNAFHKEFLRGDPKTARNALRGMLSTVEDDASEEEAPSLLEAYRGRK